VELSGNLVVALAIACKGGTMFREGRVVSSPKCNGPMIVLNEIKPGLGLTNPPMHV